MLGAGQLHWLDWVVVDLVFVCVFNFNMLRYVFLIIYQKACFENLYFGVVEASI